MKKNLYDIIRILTIIVATVLINAVLGTVVAFAYSEDVNSLMNASSYIIVQDDSSTREDPMYYKSAFSTYEEMKSFQQGIGAKLSEEGIALLKNENNALPLGRGAKINTLGSFATSLQRGGGGTGNVGIDRGWYADLLNGFEYEDNLDVNDELYSYFKELESLVSVRSIKECSTTFDEVKAKCTGSFSVNTTGLIVIERAGGEGNDLPLYGADNTRQDVEGNILALYPSELNILDIAMQLKNQGILSKVVVLLNTPNVVQMDFLKIDGGKYDALIDSIVWIGGVGHWGTRGIGKVLSGAANFSGKIVDTIPFDHKSNPVVNNFGAVKFTNAQEKGLNYTFNSQYVFYAENIYLGYKYYESRYEDYVLNQGSAGSFNYKDTIAFPFGSGLSYTSFDYSELSGERVVNGNESYFRISVKVTNTGTVSGKNIVQIYGQSPYTEYDKTNKVEKAAVSLVGFDKTNLLQPGESEVVYINVLEEDILSYDAYAAQTYVLEPGNYYFAVGKNAHNALNNILAAKGYTPFNTGMRMDESGDTNLVYTWNKTGAIDKKERVCKTGEQIYNRFKHADPLLSDIGGKDDVKYLTRNNWTGTMPDALVNGINDYSKSSVSFSVTEWMLHNGLVWEDEEFIESLAKKWETDTLKKSSSYKLEQDNSLTTIMMRGFSFDDSTWNLLLDQLSFEDMSAEILNGFRKTIAIPTISKPATVSFNGPCGLNMNRKPENVEWRNNVDPSSDRKRCGFTSNDVSAATGNKELIYLHGQAIGEDGIYTGVSGLFGPGTNIHRSPYSGRNFEYVSEDGYLTSVQTDYLCRGLNSKGMFVYQKHVLLNDQETSRGGLCTFANEQSIREIYLKAQRDSIQNADLYLVNQDKKLGDEYSFKNFDFEKGLNWGVGIMTGLNRIGCMWTGHDYNLQEAVLRGEMGATGAFITDSTNSTGYANAVAGVFGGTSLYDNNNSSNAILQEYFNRTNDARLIAAMKKSVKAVTYSVVNSCAMNGIASTDIIIPITPYWIPLFISIDAILFVLMAAGIVLLILFRNNIIV